MECLSSMIELIGDTYKRSNATGEGHLYYVGISTNGILGAIDASEMPDTYGTSFEQTRSFIIDGWHCMNNVEGDLSKRGALYQIDAVLHFQQYIVPKLTKNDVVVFINQLKENQTKKAQIILQNISTECFNKKSHICYIGFSNHSNEKNEKNQKKSGESNVYSFWNQICTANTALFLPLPRCTLLPNYIGYDGLMMKLCLNILTTCSQILAGMVYTNHMINTGPTNAKIYDRCLRLIRRFSQCDVRNSETALLRSIWNVDVVTEEIRNRTQSEHIKHAYPPSVTPSVTSTGESDAKKEKNKNKGDDQGDGDDALEYSILPLAIILGVKGESYSIEKAKELLKAEPNVRLALEAVTKIEHKQ